MDIAAAQLLVPRAGLAIELLRRPAPFGERRARPRRTFAHRRSGNAGAVHARLATRRCPHRLLRLELRALAARSLLPARLPARDVARATTRSRFDTVEVNTTFYRLPNARGRRATGSARRRRASCSRSRRRATSRTSSGCSTSGRGCERFYERIEPLLRIAEARADPLAAAAELPARRRPARRGARGARRRAAPLLRVPAPELVRRGGLRAAARARRRARDRRPAAR